MPKVNYFLIPVDVPERAIDFYQKVFGWRFETGWEYDTPKRREKHWNIITGDGSSAGIHGGLTRREYPDNPSVSESKFHQSMGGWPTFDRATKLGAPYLDSEMWAFAQSANRFSYLSQRSTQK